MHFMIHLVSKVSGWQTMSNDVDWLVKRSRLKSSLSTNRNDARGTLQERKRLQKSGD